jgi:Arc/MetJ family transcription regulator
MRTNIDIDDGLMHAVKKILRTKSKKETVEAALSEIVRRHRQQGIKALRGVGWEGDLDAWRRD